MNIVFSCFCVQTTGYNFYCLQMERHIWPHCRVWHAVTLPRGGAEAGGGGGGVARPRQAGQEEDDALLRRQEVQEQDRDRVRNAARTWRRGRAQVDSTKFYGTYYQQLRWDIIKVSYLVVSSIVGYFKCESFRACAFSANIVFRETSLTPLQGNNEKNFLDYLAKVLCNIQLLGNCKRLAAFWQSCFYKIAVWNMFIFCAGTWLDLISENYM